MNTPKNLPRWAWVLSLMLGIILLSCQQQEQPLPEADSIEAGATASAMKTGITYPDVIPLPTGFQPEGIQAGGGHDLYVGSIISGAIYKADLRTGSGSYLVPPQAGNSAVGLSYDKRTKYLYVAGGFFGNARVYHSVTGAWVATFQFTNPLSGPTMINDVIVTQDAAYFTDLVRPYLYKVPLDPTGALPDPLAFQAIMLGGDFTMAPSTPPNPSFNANGIDASPNGNHLVLVNTSLGTLYRVDPASGYADLIDLGGAVLAGGDGILLDGKKLYVVQGIINQLGVVSLSSNLLSGSVESAIADPNFRFPSTVAEFGNSLYAVNARFDVAPPYAPYPTVEFEVVRVDKP